VYKKRIIDQNRGKFQIRKCVLVIYKKQFELQLKQKLVENLFGVY